MVCDEERFMGPEARGERGEKNPPRSQTVWLVWGAAALLGVALVPKPADAQQAFPEFEIPDTSDVSVVLDAARRAQQAIERYRESEIPPELPGRARGCDERIGRMCFRFEDEESPLQTEPPELTLVRKDLVRGLGTAHSRAPADPWILGQYIAYLVEDRAYGRAQQTATECTLDEGWWCDALLGYTLQWAGDTEQSLAAFERALDTMPAEERAFWRSPEFVLDEEGTAAFAEPADDERMFARLWHLSDPLYLVPGNDRLTEHYARKVAVRIREEAANPYGLPWERDLEQLTLRYGTEVGWERGMGSPTGIAGDGRYIIGRQHPKSRQYVPAGSFLADPAAIPADEWTIEARTPRTGYAPDYAPEIGELYSQVGRFRRGDSLLVVAAYRPQPATNARPMASGPSRADQRTRSGDDPDRNTVSNPFDRTPQPPPAAVVSEAEATVATGPVQAGLFLVHPDGGTELALKGTSEQSVFGALVPNGDYVSSIEVLSPSEGKAWRARQGVRQAAVPRDLAAASDLLILNGEGELPETLEEALPRVLPGVRVARAERMVLAWEVYGLNVGERASVTIGFSQGRPSLLRRAGEFLRVVEPEVPVVVTYEDAAAEAQRAPIFRSVAMDTPELEPGDYTLHVEIQLPGRAPMVLSRRVSVLP